MRLSVSLAAAVLPLASAQLDAYAKKAGLLYFGSATDTPGQRERANKSESYSQYDTIMKNTEEFGQTTPTNGMKWLFTQPEQGVFNFTEGDVVANLAAKNGQLLRCHTLVWHSQLAPWVENTTWTPEKLTAMVEDHMTNVMTHWKGQCHAWDVVNEALNEDGSMRDSVFYRVLGDDFIKLAFRTAERLDPDAKLYYNDYNLESVGPKSEGAVRIVEMLKGEGIRIDGVGMQAHLTAAGAPSLDQMIEVMQSYADTGVEVALTELDVRVELPVNETNMEWQAEVYKNAVGACVQVDACIGVTIWDFYDPFSWVPDVFPGEGAALLWFDDFGTHPAYDAVVEALQNNTADEPARRKRELMTGRRSKKLI